MARVVTDKLLEYLQSKVSGLNMSNLHARVMWGQEGYVIDYKTYHIISGRIREYDSASDQPKVDKVPKKVLAAAKSDTDNASMALQEPDVYL
jgi:hypothetical protein